MDLSKNKILQPMETTENINKELQTFISGSIQRNVNVNSSALFLLQTLPCVREAVLQHLCIVFDQGVFLYLQQKNEPQPLMSINRTDTPFHQNEAFLREVEELLLKYIDSNALLWCPLVSTWALDLLGSISSKYNNNIQANSLNESLQTWMNCTPTKILLNLTSKCFSTMIGGDPITSVAALLDASVRYSPHFDWVVAHIGSCFPQTIIERVLHVGLKDYHAHFNERNPSNKVHSVVAIVGHLASHHREDIWLALHHLFKCCLDPQSSHELQCVYVVPYLLTLMSLSSTLLDIITKHLPQTLTNEVMNKMVGQLNHRAEIKSKANVLFDSIVHLLLRVNKSSYPLLQLILKTLDSEYSSHKTKSVIFSTCVYIMDKTLLDLHRNIFTKQVKVQDIPLLTALCEKKSEMCGELLACNNKRVYWLNRLLICIAGFGPIGVAAEILSDLITLSSTSDQLVLVYEFESVVRCRHVNVLRDAIKLSCNMFENSSIDKIKQIIDNLILLIKWEKLHKNNGDTPIISVSSLLRQFHLSHLCSQLYSHNLMIGVSALTLLIQLHPTDTINLDPYLLLEISCSVTSFIFTSLQSSDTVLKHKCVTLCSSFIQKLAAYSPVSRKAIIRILLQRALSQDYCPTFGALTEKHKPITPISKRHLLDVNSLRTPIVAPFYSGVIGKGLQIVDTTSNYSLEAQLHNRTLFLDILWQACLHVPPKVKSSAADSYFRVDSGSKPEEMDQDMPPAVEGIPPHIGVTIALILIELVAPDVMYNGIPWPGEDYIKVTIERDLIVMNRFHGNPLLWDIMEVASNAPGSMVFCSSLLRSVTGTLMSFWENCQHDTTEQCPKQLQASIRLITVMRKGQLIPAPLSYVSELFKILSPFEVHLLLANVWKYVKENPPVPDEKETATRMKCCEPRYTEVIQHLLHKNINKCGHIYSRFFH